ncbi:hypothetical protein [Luteococcus japonicus]|uniref:Uncharacterized protein n=1 Tax=Luteococcus japonicus LSP_Lj1 TaxID=1255658 RepID=A0A1R4IW02_9ACTN|nr:hypothetical protein [Luteococcus japonicus]SJN24036.1 hypothetical protein FM114_04095 [Luteococcus japonicus LSP_Lj1]
MVGTLVRLKLTLLKRSLQGQAATIIGLVMAGLYALGALVWLSVVLLRLRGAAQQLHGGSTTVGCAVLTLGWPLGTLLLAPSLIGGSAENSMASGRGILFPPIFSMLLMGSLAVAQEISYDGTPLWMHISAGISGRAALAGLAVALRGAALRDGAAGRFSDLGRPGAGP